ncbi:hypothetical protein GWO13_04940, partial [Candidatus Bathyarchaeota archaeon]|nr:hypothetical protein [Candidatus Bathyarchaeota archaeon]
SYHGVHTDDNSISSFIQIFPNSTANEKVGFSTSAQINPGTNGIQAVKIDDNFKHWIQLKQPVTVFDQQPLISDKWMKIPAKVKRINPYTFYGLWIFNDAVRGATPADTSVFLDLDSYQEARTI